MWLTRLLGLTLLACSARCLLKDCKSLEELPKGSGSGSGSGDRKVVCSNMELQQVPAVGTLPNRTVILILSNNKIQELKNGSFLGLTSLERLDIRNNGLSRIEPGAFLGLKALKRLDLSNNRISCLNAHVFTGLTSLARLYLSGNVFSSVPQETFEGLVSLKTLEFQTPYLLCDCHLRWMPRWLKAQSVTVKETRCSFPQTLLGQQVAALRPEALTCDAPLELPAFQMTPSQRQIVFRGDSLPFRCLASYVDQDMQVLWLQDGRMVQPNASMGIFIQKSTVHNCSLIASALTISNIQPGSTGTWECVIQTSRGNNTRTVPIVVLESSAKYCPPERISNNKGEFRWPRTMAGLTVHLPCHRLASGAGLYSGVSVEERRAWRRCEPSGAWLDGDYSRCQYQKDVTRVLFIINQMPLNLTNAVTTARQLLAYTVEAANFSDKMDVIFVAQMIEKFGKFAEKYKELGDVMVDIASNLMLADERVLWMAQREARACSRIVECLQRIVSHRLAAGSQAYSTTSTNIALEAHAIRASSFSGMTCTLLQKLSPERAAPREFSNRDADAGPERHLTFKCNVSSTLSSTPLKNAVVEASLQLPASLFSLSDSPGLHDEPVYKLHLLAFRNGKLFPSTGNSSLQADNGKRRSVATPVILAKIDGLPVRNLRWPVNATLRRHVHGSDPVAAYWNFSVLGGQGGWQSQGCRVLGADDNFTTVSCDSLNNYAVLLDPSGVERASSGSDLLHPVLYTTAVVLELCVLLIVGTYAIHHRSIRISRKCWHMLLNLHLHIFLTCGVFIGGINQTRYASVCQAIGIVLHYSTLATLLWVGVTARNIYKQLTRKAKRYEELDEGPPAPRPMLRFYLIGGGIPTIVCGITAAANIRNYGSRTGAPYCWMAWEPSLGAFYGPASFVTLVDCVYFLCIAVQLRRHPERRYELKDPPEEDDDDEEQQQQRLTCSEHGRSHDPDSVCQGDLLENEQTFVAQLVGAGVALLLFVALWASAALAVSRPPPLDLLFSCLCGTAALALGGFALVHHCAGRQDVRRCWAAYACPRRDCAVPLDSAHTGPASTHGDVPKCPNSSAESSCAPSVKNSSSQGCKLTNLQVEAAQCKPLPLPAPNNELAAAAAIPLDNSLTEHSLDNEIKMHVAPLEVPYRVNGTAPRPHHHHRPRSRAHRSSRLTVLREYAHDLPTSVEGGSVQSGTSRNRHEARASSRRHTAYLAHRGRLQSLQRQDSSDAGSSTLPRRTARLHNGTGKECVKQQISVELESHITKSYGVNLASPGGTVKENGALLGGEGNGSVKTGLWKHETTV